MDGDKDQELSAASSKTFQDVVQPRIDEETTGARLKREKEEADAARAKEIVDAVNAAPMPDNKSMSGTPVLEPTLKAGPTVAAPRPGGILASLRQAK